VRKSTSKKRCELRSMFGRRKDDEAVRISKVLYSTLGEVCEISYANVKSVGFASRRFRVRHKLRLQSSRTSDSTNFATKDDSSQRSSNRGLIKFYIKNSSGGRDVRKP